MGETLQEALQEAHRLRRTRALPLIEEIARMARALDTRFMIRLVKGAYWDYEVKRAQELGLPGFAVFTHKHHTDLCYPPAVRVAAPAWHG